MSVVESVGLSRALSDGSEISDWEGGGGGPPGARDTHQG